MTAEAASTSAEDEDWVHHTQVSNWVRLLADWGSNFPDPGTGHSGWQGFLAGSLSLPIVLIVLGAITAAVTLFVLCRVHIKASAPQGRHPWMHFAMICMATLALFVVGMYFCLVEGNKGYMLASSELASAGGDVRTAKDMAEALNISGGSVGQNLDRLYSQCPASTHQFLKASVQGLQSDIADFMRAVWSFSSRLQGLPEQLASVEGQSRAIGTFVDWCLSMPILSLGVCYVGVGSIVAIAESGHPKWIRRCSCLQLPCLGAFCVAPAVLLVAFVSAMELAVGVMSSAFCTRADNITLSYARDTFGIDSDGFNLTRHYVTGKGPNPALRDLSIVKASIASSISWVETYGPAVVRSCPSWDIRNVSTNLQTLQISMGEAERLLQPSHVYSYYRSTVHDAICGTAVPELGWLVMFQLLLGLVCLPALACAASCLLDTLIAEKNGYAFDPLGAEEDVHQDQENWWSPNSWLHESQTVS
eukprot:TRINITY_DN27958_c0_g1_i1.p1 TRINITY_DN27958_c0_g1~~TRINITY_DN27958_c0_g1_i1.p1  ORF type:complete len:486 (-),score=76.24 TRINITY_DN27958_c0_g1_i1:7-1431(-)